MIRHMFPAPWQRWSMRWSMWPDLDPPKGGWLVQDGDLFEDIRTSHTQIWQDRNVVARKWIFLKTQDGWLITGKMYLIQFLMAFLNLEYTEMANQYNSIFPTIMYWLINQSIFSGGIQNLKIQNSVQYMEGVRTLSLAHKKNSSIVSYVRCRGRRSQVPLCANMEDGNYVIWITGTGNWQELQLLYKCDFQINLLYYN